MSLSKIFLLLLSIKIRCCCCCRCCCRCWCCFIVAVVVDVFAAAVKKIIFKVVRNWKNKKKNFLLYFQMYFVLSNKCNFEKASNAEFFECIKEQKKKKRRWRERKGNICVDDRGAGEVREDEEMRKDRNKRMEEGRKERRNLWKTIW